MNSPLVDVQQGRLRGTVRRNLNNENFFCFLGIPYAKPPTGELRFKAPIPAEAWSGERDGTKEGNKCFTKNGTTFSGSEDCLNLNIFTKHLQSNNMPLKPVMVFIHGGGFLGGSNSTKSHGPEYLMIEDVVLVTINYRLGILGFLSLEDTSLDVPGNAGLKDQIMALKWVQKNIRKFNGDPDNVTVFGQSSGSIAIHYLILSAAARGLFHKAILQSGTALNSLGAGDRFVKKLVKHLNKEWTGDREVLDMLKITPAEELCQAQEKLYEEMTPSYHKAIGPIVEYPNPTAVITKAPIEIITAGEYNKMPIIIGYTSREGIVKAFDEMEMRSLGQPLRPFSLEDYIPWNMHLEGGSETTRMICKKLKDFYFSGENTNDKYLLDTDSLIVAGVLATAKNHSMTSQEPVFLYRFSVESRLNASKHFMNTPGVCHGDDMAYLFKISGNFDFETGSVEDIYVRRLVKLWTNFAKYGNPTPSKDDLNIIWKPVEGTTIYYLDIGKKLTLDVNPENDRMNLWKEILRLSSHTDNFL